MGTAAVMASLTKSCRRILVEFGRVHKGLMQASRCREEMAFHSHGVEK